MCRDENGVVVGAEKKGTYVRSDGTKFSGMAAGSEKDRGGFRIGSIAKAKAIYLVESAIDAISLAKLRSIAGDKDFSVISTAGTTPEPRKWFAGLADTVRKFCGFDNDAVGDAAANKLRRNKFERIKPQGHDWNDDLKAYVQQGSGGSTQSTTTLDDDTPTPS